VRADGGPLKDGTERCPNCQQKGQCEISAAESGADRHTFGCNNINCRVRRYYVEPDTDRSEGGDVA
jgi:hypothetical protein